MCTKVIYQEASLIHLLKASPSLILLLSRWGSRCDNVSVLIRDVTELLQYLGSIQKLKFLLAL